MADFAGAIAALRTYFAAQWVDGQSRRTPIAFQNEAPNDGGSPPVAISPWPPTDESGAPRLWVYFEVQGNAGDLRGAGLPGDHVYLDTGHIVISAFGPKGSGSGDDGGVAALAVAAGNIFRSQTLYQDGAGAKLVCSAPYPPRDAVAVANSGNQYGQTVSVPFEFFYRA